MDLSARLRYIIRQRIFEKIDKIVSLDNLVPIINGACMADLSVLHVSATFFQLLGLQPRAINVCSVVHFELSSPKQFHIHRSLVKGSRTVQVKMNLSSFKKKR